MAFTESSEIDQMQIVNFSAKSLSFDKLFVLLYSLSFVPTYHFNLFDTIIDVNRFVRQFTVKKKILDHTVILALIRTCLQLMILLIILFVLLFYEKMSICNLRNLQVEFGIENDTSMSRNYITKIPSSVQFKRDFRLSTIFKNW